MRTLLLLLQLFGTAQANTPTPSPSWATPAFLQLDKKAGDDATTNQMIDQQSKSMDTGTRTMISTQDSLVSGRARAQEMMDLLKGQELQKVFGNMNERGKQMLQENPEMKNPIAIVAGAVSLWVGRSIKIIKDEKFKLSTRLEARARSGEFSMESPILNGRLSYSASDGVNMNMNRDLTIINSRAEMNYNQKDQWISGSVSHPLMPHLDLTFGATQWQQSNQTDGRASIQYNLSF